MKMNLKRLFKVRNSRKIKIFSMALICALAVSMSALPTAQATTWYVDAGVTGGNGSSWGSAYDTIQEAIDATIPGDEIWVRGGTYFLGNQINVDEAVKIYGGFNGTEINKEERDWTTNVTIIDGQDSVHHVLFVTADVRIDGFTITGGNAGFEDPPPESYDIHGGGNSYPKRQCHHRQLYSHAK